MTAQPDLSTLPERMRYAAHVIREVAKRSVPPNFGDTCGRFGPDELESLAFRYENEDRKSTEEDALARAVAKARGYACQFESLYSIDQIECRHLATEIIAAGWRREPRQ